MKKWLIDSVLTELNKVKVAPENQNRVFLGAIFPEKMITAETIMLKNTYLLSYLPAALYWGVGQGNARAVVFWQ